MAELRPTDYYAKITWLGKVPLNRPNIRAEAVLQAQATYAGFEDDYHGGLTRASCVRVRDQHPKGTEIRNTRQLSILSVEEMAQIAADLDLEALDPALLGASIVLEGIPDFTFVTPGSRLQSQSGATIVIDVENGPCNFPAREIENEAKGHGKAFITAARGKRGVTAWVEREGELKVGETLRLHVPDQRAWQG
jgi:MOSC domain-containing protein YiiM